MRKLLLVLFIYSLSSNVFADEFDEFEEVAERKYIICYDPDFIGGFKHRYSTDGKNIYDWDGDNLLTWKPPLTIIKKSGALKFIVKNLKYIWYKPDGGIIAYSWDSVLFDFEDTNMIVNDNGSKTRFTCTSVYH